MMKFKQYWRMIYRDVYGGLAICNACALPVYYAAIELKDLPLFFTTFVFHMLFCLDYLWLMYLHGTFTNTLIFDNEIITYIERKEKPKQMRWEDIDHIVRTRHDGRALVIWDVYGQMIWFGNNKKIEGYIHTNHPELDHLFPEKNDLRMWQEWDKKLWF